MFGLATSGFSSRFAACEHQSPDHFDAAFRFDLELATKALKT